MEKSFLDVVKWQGNSVVVFTTFLGCSQGALGRREGSMLGIFLTSLRVVSCVIQMFALPLHPF